MCHSRRHHPHTVRVAREADLQDDLRRRPDLRASDAEREEVVTRLRAHGAAGRLDVAELEDRVGAAYASATRGELAWLLEDLPPLPRQARQPPPARAATGELGAFLVVAVLLVAVWALTGAGYFWPVWAIGWWAVALAVKLPRVRAAVGLRGG
jgi:hypothetical protein